MIDFENPMAFFLLLLIPLYYFLRRIKFFSKISFPLTMSNWNGSNFEWKQPGRKFLTALIKIFVLGGFICTVIAAANPVLHHQKKVYVSKGADILFVLDTSPSMAAKDISGMTRLSAAKQAIYTLSQENDGASMGLVEMARESAIVVPPTLDRKSFFDRLEKLAVGEMGDGTAIGTGLSCAVFHLSKSTAPKKSIVLITDGENNAGAIHPYTAAHLIKEKNISLYILGIGSRGNFSVEYVNPKTGKVTVGSLESHYDVQNMAQLAGEGGGEFFVIESMNELSQELNSIVKHEAVVQSYHMRNEDQLFFPHFIFFAAVLLALAWIFKRVFLQEMI